MAKATVPTISNTSTPEEVHAQLKETGCCIIKNLVPESLKEQMLEELDPWWDKTPPGPKLPDEIVEKSRDRYLDAYKRLTGSDL